MLENVIEWLNDRNNVTLLIAIAGFALSLWNMVEAQLKNRKNVQIYVQNVFRSGPNEKDFYAEILNVTFINKSREAITLSGLAVECDGKIHRFGEYQQMLIEKKRTTGNREISRSTWHSDTFPQKLEGLGCVHMLVSTTTKDLCIKSQSPYVFILYTNKGTIKKTLVNDISDIKALSECRAPDWHTEALKG